MAGFIPNPLGRRRVARTPASLLLCMAGLAAAASCAAATRAMQQQSILLDAQSFELDYKNNTMTYHKVRIAQGNMSVAADQAQTLGTGGTAALDFENSRWIFRGAVKIAMDQGQLTSDEAEITFAKKLLVKAVATGKPAAFEQRIAKTGKLAQGHADSIDYDVAKGVVHLSSSAWLSDGQNEIRGESLKYNVVSQNIVAESTEQGTQRVHIIITPQAVPKP